MKLIKIIFFALFLISFGACTPEDLEAVDWEEVGRLEAFELQLDKLKTRDIQDENEILGGDHDEPILIVFYFQAKFFEPASTVVEVNRYKRNENWSPDLADQEIVSVPAYVGHNDFDPFTKRTVDEILLEGAKPSVVGAVLVAIEHDNTPWSTIDGMVNTIKEELKSQLVDLVENATLGDLIDQEGLIDKMTTAIDEINQATSLSCWEKFVAALESFLHPDDFIGVNFLAYIGIDDESVDFSEYNTDVFQINPLGNYNYEIGTNPITFRTSTAIYEIEGSFSKK